MVPTNGKNPTFGPPVADPADAGRPYVRVRPLAHVTRPVGACSFTRERYRGLAMDEHAHDGWQLVVPLTGRAHLKVGREAFMIGPQVGVAIPPQAPHANVHVPGDYEYVALLAPPSWVSARAAGGRAVVLVEPFVWPLVRQIAAELAEPRPDTDALLAAGITQLAVLVARSLAGERREDRALDPRVLQALDRMTRGFDPELSIAALAAEVHLTPRHFERLFKHALGRTPREHLLEVRLARARRLLEGNDRPMADVAADVGFYDASHFIAAFRRAFDETPAAYRRGFQTRAPDTRS